MATRRMFELVPDSGRWATVDGRDPVEYVNEIPLASTDAAPTVILYEVAPCAGARADEIVRLLRTRVGRRVAWVLDRLDEGRLELPGIGTFSGDGWVVEKVDHLRTSMPTIDGVPCRYVDVSLVIRRVS
jgi:hypothetical protein